jgi:hypothetical protein
MNGLLKKLAASGAADKKWLNVDCDSDEKTQPCTSKQNKCANSDCRVVDSKTSVQVGLLLLPLPLLPLLPLLALPSPSPQRAALPLLWSFLAQPATTPNHAGPDCSNLGQRQAQPRPALCQGVRQQRAQ